MNWIKIWKPFLYFKMVEKIGNIPVFSKILNNFLQKIEIVKSTLWVNMKCMCCGGFLGSVRKHLYFEWVCLPSERTKKCEYFGKDKDECSNNPNCLLRTDAKVIEQRKFIYKLNRSEILEIIRRHGVCIIDKENEEVVDSLTDILKFFIVLAFRGKDRRYLTYEEGDEIIHKEEEHDTIFLILYPTISYRALEFIIKLLNMDKELLRDIIEK